MAGRRARPPRRAVEDADAGERPFPRTLATRPRRFPFGCLACAEGARLGTGNAVRDARLAEPARRRRPEHAARHELFEGRDRLAVEHRPGGDPPGRGFVQDLGRRPRHREGVHSGRELLAPLEADVRPGQVLVLDQVRAPDHAQQRLELLGAVGGEHHVAVGRRFDGRDLDGTPRALHPRPAHERREHRLERRHGDRHAVEHGHVHVLTDARSLRRAQGGNRADRRVRPGQPLPQAAARSQRRVLRKTPRGRRPARRLQGEFGRRPPGPRPFAPERRDGDHDEGGVLRPHRLEVDRLLRDQDVGSRHQPAVVTRNGALRRPQVLLEPATVGRTPADHVGACVSQELRAVRARDLPRAVEDAHSLEHRRIMPPGGSTAGRSRRSPGGTRRRGACRQPGRRARSRRSSSSSGSLRRG